MAWWFGGFGRRRRGKGRGGPGPCWWYWYNQYNQSGSNQYGSWWTPGWGYGRGYGRGWWMWNSQMYPTVQNVPTQQNISTLPADKGTMKSIADQAKNILRSSYAVEPFPGAPWMQIIYNGRAVGYIWEKVNIKDLDVGNPTQTGAYWSVPLRYKGKVVGYIYV